MEYLRSMTLKDGRGCIIRSAASAAAAAVLETVRRCYGQTDNLLSYPDECTFTVEMEADFLEKRLSDPRAVLLAAEVNGRLAGTAGLDPLGGGYKIRHRAELGVSVDSAFWGLGIGRALTQSIIDCARTAGYAQLELTVVGDNAPAIALYKSLGFREFGRLSRGLRSRVSGWQETVMMLLELD